MINNKRIAIALSGGVDSAATAYILKEQGYDVFGITMKVFPTQDVEDAVENAKHLDIEHHVVDFSNEFKNDVINQFIEMYLNGYTPNPCIFCNIYMKYGKLLDEALKLGASHMATGHYAKILYDKTSNIYRIYKSNAQNKDQTYNLYHISQDRLKYLMFPLGDFNTKDEVRKYISNPIPNVSTKKDSTNICFLEGTSIVSFIKKHKNIINCSGNFILDKNNKIIGKHKGIFNYTIGQKRGLGLNLQKSLYIKEILPSSNEIILTEDESSLYKSEIKISKINYLNNDLYKKDRFDVDVKLCQWGYLVKAEIINLNSNSILLKFKEPQRAPSNGQAAVFYSGSELLGGGIISN